jgi:phosphoserine phosphatase
VGLLSGLPVGALERVYQERLKLSPGAEVFLSALKATGIKTLLVSGGFTFFTERLQTRLGLDYTASNSLEIVNGKLTGQVLGNIVDADAKAAWLVKTRDELGLSPEQVVAIGDGANDLKMLAEAGVSIAYRAKAVVQEKAHYALNFSGLDGVISLLG